MKSVSGKKIIKLLEKIGWIHHRTTGSHWIYKNLRTKKVVSVPVHGNRDLPTRTLRNIMRQTDLTEEDLF